MAAKLWIDTDIGDDIDDALAIRYALAAGCEITGISTVFRNAKRRAQITKALIRTCGKAEIPVYAGTDSPLVAYIPVFEEDAAQSGDFVPCQYLSGMEQECYEAGHGVDALLDAVRAQPGEITLVPIGPLTNIALAIRKEPETMRQLKGITLMGGCFAKKFPEWNIRCDPEAARIVFTSGIPLRAVGTDVTGQCKLDGSFAQQLRQRPDAASALLAEMLERWCKASPFGGGPVLHDPLAIGTLVSGAFAGFAPQTVRVELGESKYGLTSIVDPNEIDPDEPDALYAVQEIDVAQTADGAAFVRDFLKKLEM